MNRTRVLLLFGGESSEHDVSISSARNVCAAIDDEKYEPLLCYIDRSGKWWLLDELDRDISTDGCEQLMPMLGSGSFMVYPDKRIIKPDVIFPILHGRNGEDGTVQGLVQLTHIPIVGCDVTASGIAMNKLATKQILQANGINIIPYDVHRQYQETPDFGKLTMQLGNPLFVKPARAGSSVGVSKVHTASEFQDALDLAHEHDSIVLIEKAISGQELEVAALGTPPAHKVSGVGEVVPGESFYTYADKYAQDSAAKVTVEANVDTEAKEAIRTIADRVYELLDCRGLARIDFILSDEGTPYLLEVNTLPGFTNISMYPKLWRNQGIGYTDLITALIEDARGSATIVAE